MLRIPSIPHEPPSVVEIFRDVEESRLCALPEIRDRALMLLLFGSGIRDGEARSVRLQDVDFDQRTLYVEGKGRRQRLIPLPARTLAAVDELATFEALNPDDFLWYRSWTNQAVRRYMRERRIVYSGFLNWWTRNLRQAKVSYQPRNPKLGIPSIHNPHCTRHTYATKYLRAGGKLERLSRILGHSSVAITERYYAHMNVGDLAEDADLVMAMRRWDEG